MEFIIHGFEVVGTLAFAISGALLGIKKRLDFFGVLMLAIITAVGGGILRDIILGNTPPTAFENPKFIIISTLAALIVFFFHRLFFRFNNVILFFDAIGLGIFTAMGARVVLQQGFSSLFMAASLGVITGVGGGILRDLFVKEIPLVFKKEIYATASLMGGIAYYYSQEYLNGSIPLFVCLFVTLVIRLVSLNYKLNLPVSRETKLNRDIYSNQ